MGAGVGLVGPEEGGGVTRHHPRAALRPALGDPQLHQVWHVLYLLYLVQSCEYDNPPEVLQAVQTWIILLLLLLLLLLYLPLVHPLSGLLL